LGLGVRKDDVGRVGGGCKHGLFLVGIRLGGGTPAGGDGCFARRGLGNWGFGAKRNPTPRGGAEGATPPQRKTVKGPGVTEKKPGGKKTTGPCFCPPKKKTFLGDGNGGQGLKQRIPYCWGARGPRAGEGLRLRGGGDRAGPNQAGKRRKSGGDDKNKINHSFKNKRARHPNQVVPISGVRGAGRAALVVKDFGGQRRFRPGARGRWARGGKRWSPIPPPPPDFLEKKAGMGNRGGGFQLLASSIFQFQRGEERQPAKKLLCHEMGGGAAAGVGFWAFFFTRGPIGPGQTPTNPWKLPSPAPDRFQAGQAFRGGVWFRKGVGLGPLRPRNVLGTNARGGKRFLFRPPKKTVFFKSGAGIFFGGRKLWLGPGKAGTFRPIFAEGHG